MKSWRWFKRTTHTKKDGNEHRMRCSNVCIWCVPFCMVISQFLDITFLIENKYLSTIINRSRYVNLCDWFASITWFCFNKSQCYVFLCSLFSPWYIWKIAHLALSNNLTLLFLWCSILSITCMCFRSMLWLIAFFKSLDVFNFAQTNLKIGYKYISYWFTRQVIFTKFKSTLII